MNTFHQYHHCICSCNKTQANVTQLRVYHTHAKSKQACHNKSKQDP